MPRSLHFAERDRASSSTDRTINLPASNDVFDAFPIETFALLSMPNANELRPYTVPRSHFHPLASPFSPTDERTIVDVRT